MRESIPSSCFRPKAGCPLFNSPDSRRPLATPGLTVLCSSLLRYRGVFDLPFAGKLPCKDKGIILAATIVGAAILMHVQTPQFTLFGYPGPAIIFLLIAAIGGLLFAILMLINDEKQARK